MAIEHELAAWQRIGAFSDRDNALRWAAGWGWVGRTPVHMLAMLFSLHICAGMQ